MKYIGVISLSIAMLLGYVVHQDNQMKQVQELETIIEQQAGVILEQEQLVLDKEQTILEQSEQLSEQENQINELLARVEELKSVKNFDTTSYVPFCDTGCIGVTASGYDVSNNQKYGDFFIIATDPDVIPLGSIVEMEWNGEKVYAISLDTGGDIKGHRIDFLVKDKHTAIKNGYKEELPVNIIGQIDME